MSIKKLLSTGACMVIIGASAGASYGLFQKLTHQVASPAVAASDPVLNESTTENSASAQFVAANVTTWIPPEKSNVSAPVLDKPAAFVQPEPPLLRYTSTHSDDAVSNSPVLPLYAHIDDAIVLGVTPNADSPINSAVVTASPEGTSIETNAHEVIVAFAPRSVVSPGTSRRFRGHDQKQSENASDGDQDGRFRRLFPPRNVLKPAQTRRPSVAATTRNIQRNARFRRTWSIGVYR